MDPLYERRGGLAIALSEDELAERRRMLEQIHAEQGETRFEYEIIDRAELKRRVPAIGPEAVGAGYTRYDGAASPLHLLRGLHAAVLARGGAYVPHARVTAIEPQPGAFTVTAGGQHQPRGSATRTSRRLRAWTPRCARCAATLSSPNASNR